MKLQLINIGKLRNEDTHGLCLATVNLFKAHVQHLDSTAKAAFEKLKTQTSELGSQLNRQRANFLSKDIDTLNKMTDSVWKEIKAAVTRTAKSLVNNTKTQAAVQLTNFLKPYWDSENQSHHTQTANFAEMFAKYNADTDMQAKAQTVGVDEALALLETKNTEMAALWQQRNDIQGNITAAPSASNIRKDTATTYTRFCQAVENQHTFTPTAELTVLISDMNEIRNKYSNLIGVRAAASKRIKDKQALPPPPKKEN